MPEKIKNVETGLGNELKDKTLQKVENVIEYYVLTNKLKQVVRSGWKYWNVKKERLESIAEHIYGTCMLAIAIWSESLPTVNLAEVLMTLAVHETEEIIIGDLTPYDKEYANKKQMGEKAIEEIFGGLMCREIYTTLIKNFDNQSTPEAVFAYKCDKLECDLQAKLYDEKNVSLFENANETIKKNPALKKLSERGAKKMSTFFMQTDKSKFPQSENSEVPDLFYEVVKYIEKNPISKFDKYPVKQEQKQSTEKTKELKPQKLTDKK